MISIDCMRRRVVSCIVGKGGQASKADIIKSAKGAKFRLIRTIDLLVESGIILKEGSGTKGSPHVFTLAGCYPAEALVNEDSIITVTL